MTGTIPGRPTNECLGIAPMPRFELVAMGETPKWFFDIPSAREHAREHLNGQKWTVQEHCNRHIHGAEIVIVDVWNSMDERNAP